MDTVINVFDNHATINTGADTIILPLDKLYEGLGTKLESTITTPLLPTSCISYTAKGLTKIIVLDIPQRYYTATHRPETRVRIGSDRFDDPVYRDIPEFDGLTLGPRTLAIVVLGTKIDNSGHFIRDVFLFALPKTAVRGMNALLYCYPFGNIYPEEGRVCFGQVTTEIAYPMDNLTGLDSILNLFFTSPFNHDLDGQNNFNMRALYDMVDYARMTLTSVRYAEESNRGSIILLEGIAQYIREHPTGEFPDRILIPFSQSSSGSGRSRNSSPAEITTQDILNHIYRSYAQ